MNSDASLKTASTFAFHIHEQHAFDPSLHGHNHTLTFRTKGHLAKVSYQPCTRDFLDGTCCQTFILISTVAGSQSRLR